MIVEFGITRPNEIDLEAIAYDSGIEVHYDKLSGCEATLVGVGDRALVTVNQCGNRGRERFSVGHEIGHWQMHRGRSFRCRVDDADSNLAANKPLEKEADTFAAHLLLPAPLFVPLVQQIGQPNFQQLALLGDDFATSLMATALRLANVNTLPVIVASYSRLGKRWSLPAADLPKRWFLKDKLDADSCTYDLLFEGKECKHLSKQSGDTWFVNDDAGKYTVLEQCVPGRAGEALVILYLESSMLRAGFDWNVNRRYNDKGSYVPRRN